MKTTTVIVDKIYPIVAKSIPNNTSSYKRNLQKFIEARSKSLYDTAPCDRMFYGAEDEANLFKSLKIDKKEVLQELKGAYFWGTNFNPRAALEPYVETMMMVIRYFVLKGDRKNAEISAIYLAFSGKFYPSVHSGKFPIPPSENRHVMDYVVNNMLTQKFDLKREGSVFGAIRSLCITWLDTYSKLMKNPDDEDVADMIQQLHGRIKSFMGNIAKMFYDAYENKNYLSFDSDSNDEEDYRVADQDSLRMERYVENTMNHINTNAVDFKLCKMASDSNVKVTEVKSIIESIQDDQHNIGDIKELIRITIAEYMNISKDKNVASIDFVSKSIVAKPNTKNKNIIRQKEIIEHFLDENSAAYRKRKSRAATKSSYFKSVLIYYVLLINKANK